MFASRIVVASLLTAALPSAQTPVEAPSSPEVVQLLERQVELGEEIARLRGEQVERVAALVESGAASRDDLDQARLEQADARLALLEARQRLSATTADVEEASRIAAERVRVASERVAAHERAVDRTEAAADQQAAARSGLHLLEARMALLDARRALLELEREAGERTRRIARLDRAISHTRREIEASERLVSTARQLHDAGRADVHAMLAAEDDVRALRLRLLELRAQRVRMDGAEAFGRFVDVLAERVAVLEERVEARRKDAILRRSLVDSGRGSPTDVTAAEAALHDAELSLVDAREELQALKGR